MYSEKTVRNTVLKWSKRTCFNWKLIRNSSKRNSLAWMRCLSKSLITKSLKSTVACRRSRFLKLTYRPCMRSIASCKITYMHHLKNWTKNRLTLPTKWPLILTKSIQSWWIHKTTWPKLTTDWSRQRMEFGETKTAISSLAKTCLISSFRLIHCKKKSSIWTGS